jgi:hypothetical protein
MKIELLNVPLNESAFGDHFSNLKIGTHFRDTVRTEVWSLLLMSIQKCFSSFVN